MIITISGKPGSGKGTVAALLAKKLHMKYWSMGAIRRQMAIDRGMTLEELNALGETEGFTDQQVDFWQRDLGRTKDNPILEGRTSFHFVPHSVKVFLDVELPEAARRIFHDPVHLRRFEAKQKFDRPADVLASLQRRIASDTKRYRKHYDLNIFSRRHYDLWIDTTHQTPPQVAKAILAYIAKNPDRAGAGNNRGKRKRAIHSYKPAKKPGRKMKKSITLAKRSEKSPRS